LLRCDWLQLVRGNVPQQMEFPQEVERRKKGCRGSISNKER